MCWAVSSLSNRLWRPSKTRLWLRRLRLKGMWEREPGGAWGAWMSSSKTHKNRVEEAQRMKGGTEEEGEAQRRKGGEDAGRERPRGDRTQV